MAFAVSVFVARTLGVDNTGVFFLTTTIIFVTASIGRFGLDNVVIRFISSNASTEKWSGVKSVFASSLFIVVVLTGFLSVIVYVFAEQISLAIFHKPELIIPLKWMTIRIIPFSVITIVSESLRGLKKIGWSQMTENIWTPAFTLLLLIMIPYYHTLEGIVLIWNTVSIIVMIIALFTWIRTTTRFAHIKTHYSFRFLIHSGYPLFLVMILNMIICWSSTIFLGIFAENADVGIYNAAARTANLMNFLLVSVNTIAAPKFAELFHINDMQGLKRSAQDSTRLMFWLSLPVFIIVMIFSKNIMGIFGDQFITGTAILMILSTSQFVNVSTGSVGYLLMMSGNEKLLRNNIFGVAIINIILSVWLIPKYGMLGAGVVSAISLTLQNVISLLLVKRKLNFWTIPFFERFNMVIK